MEGKKIPKEINYWKRTIRKMTGFIAVLKMYINLDNNIFDNFNNNWNHLLFCIKIKIEFVKKNQKNGFCTIKNYGKEEKIL